MTDERLEEIEQRLKQASPGPWKKCTGGNRGDCSCNIIWGVETAIAETVHAGSHGYQGEDMMLTQAAAHKNAHLIAHAPSDIADLLAEVKRLRAELAKKNPVILDVDEFYPPNDSE